MELCGSEIEQHVFKGMRKGINKMGKIAFGSKMKGFIQRMAIRTFNKSFILPILLILLFIFI
jgi:hypothetical protein